MQWTRKQRFVCYLAYLLTRALHITYRYRWYGLDHYDAAKARSPAGSVAIAVWHQNALASALSHAGRRLAVIVSHSFDGEIIASILARLGVRSARGSSSRGGTEALREVLKLVRQGIDVGITVDGPRGPRHEVKPGVVALASRTGSAILPLVAIGHRTWSLQRSWDQFRIPVPFTKVYCVYGEPMDVPASLSEREFDAYREQLKSTLIQLEGRVLGWQLDGPGQREEAKGLRPGER